MGAAGSSEQGLGSLQRGSCGAAGRAQRAGAAEAVRGSSQLSDPTHPPPRAAFIKISLRRERLNKGLGGLRRGELISLSQEAGEVRLNKNWK